MNTQFQELKKITLIMTAAILSACGGGGSGGGDPVKVPDPVAVNKCSNGASDYPTCTPPYIAADLQLTVSKPPFADGSEDMRAFDFINDLRSSLGLGKLSYSAELTKAATNHVNYQQINSIVDHFEKPSLVGFTGVSPADRANVVGYSSSFVSEAIVSGNTKTAAIERLLHSVFHRSTLLDQSWRDMGSGVFNFQDGGASVVINYGYKSPQRNASDFLMTYPKDGQTNVRLGMCGENPWPFPEVPVTEACTNPKAVNGLIVFEMKVGYPVSITIEAKKELKVGKFQIFEAGSNISLPTWLLVHNGTPESPSKNEAYIASKGGLKPNTKYEVTFSGTSDGFVFNKSWSFTTGTN